MSSGAFIVLLKMQLRQRLGLSVLRHQLRERPFGWWRGASIALAAFLGIGTLIGFYVWLLYQMGVSLAAVGIAQLLPFMGLLASMTGTLIAGTAFLLSILYLNRDAEALMALPVTGRTVFAVKMSQAFLGEAAASIPMAWPVFIVFGIVSKAGPLYYLMAVAVWLCALSLPLVLSALATLPLMRWSALWRRRDLVAIIGGLALMIGFISGEMWLTSKLPALLEGDVMVQWLMGRVDLFDRIARAIPPLWLSLRALTASGVGALGYLAGLIALSAALTAVALWLSGTLYQQGVSAQTESHMNVKRVDFGGRVFRQRSPAAAAALREFRLTLRTPVYAMNTVTLIVVFPVMIMAMLLASSAASDPELDAMIALFRRFISDPWMIALLSAGMSLFIGAMNSAPSTSISREGRMFIWSRVVPVPYAVQARGKLLFALGLSWLGSLLTCASLQLSLNLPISGVILGFALSVPALIPVAVIQLTVDITRPKLHWTNPIEAIKQNLNVMLGMGLALIYEAALIVPAVLLIVNARVSPWILFAVCVPLTIILAVVSMKLLTRFAEKGYSRIEI